MKKVREDGNERWMTRKERKGGELMRCLQIIMMMMQMRRIEILLFHFYFYNFQVSISLNWIGLAG